MRKVFSSIIIFSSILIFVVGCKGQEDNGQVTGTQSEILADGSEVSIETTPESNVESLVEQENELKNLIADQLEITEESISIMLSEISDGELSLSLILDVEQELNNQSLQELTDNMIYMISEKENMSIQQENIVIFDGGNNLLN